QFGESSSTHWPPHASCPILQPRQLLKHAWSWSTVATVRILQLPAPTGQGRLENTHRAVPPLVQLAKPHSNSQVRRVPDVGRSEGADFGQRLPARLSAATKAGIPRPKPG